MDLFFDKCEIMSFIRNQGLQNDYIMTYLANGRAFLVSRSQIHKDLCTWIQNDLKWHFLHLIQILK